MKELLREIQPYLDDHKLEALAPLALDYISIMNNYESKIREFQGIVRDKVNLTFGLQNPSSRNSEFLFISDYTPSYEFERWSPLEQAEVNGDILATISSALRPDPYLIFSEISDSRLALVTAASFKEGYGQKDLDEIKSYAEILKGLVKPLNELNLFDIHNSTLLSIFDELGNSDRPELSDRLNETTQTEIKNLLKNTFQYREGILSLAVVNGIIHKLEATEEKTK
tara:strand:- start:379 stop:1056 length:678 start_codon:yes stop_codon:yes gene_type:complete